MKYKQKIIAVVSVLALLATIAISTATNLSNKTSPSVDVSNALERASAPISCFGEAISEDVSGLAFGFKVNVKGITTPKGSSEAIYNKATVVLDGKTYKLLGMGAVAHNDGSGIPYEIEDCDGKKIVNIPAVYLLSIDSKNGTASFAIRITQIPKKALDVHIAVIPYIIVENNGVKTTIYGDLVTRTFNEVANEAPEECESCYSVSGTEKDFKIFLYGGANLNTPPVTGSANGTTTGIVAQKGTVTVKWVNGRLMAFIKCYYEEKTHVIVIPKK